MPEPTPPTQALTPPPAPGLPEGLLEASRLQVLGALAGGIAHDFNNLLTAILASVSLAEVKLRSGNGVQDELRSAREACERARRLTHQLLTIARGGPSTPALIHVGDLVEEAAAFALQGSRSRLEFHAPVRELMLEAVPRRVGQVVHNLVINAHQAMPGGGVVRVRVRDRLQSPGDGRPTRLYAVVEVSDQGPGIAPEDQDRIFDPFYSTREGGGGLGLATVLTEVGSLGGWVEVDSPPGGGATFRVYLPAHAGPLEDIPAAPVTPIRGGHGRILVMDDEATIREVAREALETLGYEVSVAPDGEEAVLRLASAIFAHDPYDAVVLDLTVPGGLGALETLPRLRALDPGVPVLVSSGYATDPVLRDPSAHGFAGVVVKPWDVPELDRVLARLLAR